jgi:cytochrome P450
MMTEPVLDTSNPALRMEDLVTAAREAPTAVELQSGAVIALRYHEIDRLAHDRRMAGVGLTWFDVMGIDGVLRQWYSELMFTNEGEPHARMRRLVSRAFTPRSVEQLRHDTKVLVAQGFDAIEAAGAGDLVASFGRLGTRVMCRLLGVPDEDVHVFGGWADALSRIFGLMDPEQIAEASSALAGMLAYASELVDHRDGVPGDDLITCLLRAEHDGDKLTRHEVITMVANLLVAAHDTTASQLSCSLLTLLRHPEDVPSIRAGDVAAADAVTETMRFEPAIALFPRTVLEPVEIGGVERAAGTMVLLAVGAANRDPEVYSEPDRFQVGRFSSPDVPRPLSFGTGPHFCLGSHLARMVIEETIAGFAERSLRLSTDQVEWRMVLGRSPMSLPVEVTTGGEDRD